MYVRYSRCSFFGSLIWLFTPFWQLFFSGGGILLFLTSIHFWQQLFLTEDLHKLNFYCTGAPTCPLLFEHPGKNLTDFWRTKEREGKKNKKKRMAKLFVGNAALHLFCSPRSRLGRFGRRVGGGRESTVDLPKL